MIGIAIVHDVGFVARGFAGNSEQLSGLIQEGISHRGLAVIEVMQPCITWGSHPVSWYRERIRPVDDDYDDSDPHGAPDKTAAGETIATGVLYRSQPRPVFADRFRKEITDHPLYHPAASHISKVSEILNTFAPVSR